MGVYGACLCANQSRVRCDAYGSSRWYAFNDVRSGHAIPYVVYVNSHVSHLYATVAFEHVSRGFLEKPGHWHHSMSNATSMFLLVSVSDVHAHELMCRMSAEDEATPEP